MRGTRSTFSAYLRIKGTSYSVTSPFSCVSAIAMNLSRMASATDVRCVILGFVANEQAN